MCILNSSSKLSPYTSLTLSAATANTKPAIGFHVHHRRRRLSRRRKLSREAKNRLDDTEKEMKMKNLKLYIENKSMIQENEKLRMKALLLHQENQALLSQLQNIFSKKKLAQ